MCPHIFFSFHIFFLAAPNMADSDSSVHGGHRGDREPPVSRDEMRRMADSLMEAMGRLLDERLPAAGGRRARRDQEDRHRAESGDENSGFGHGFNRFGDGPEGSVGGRHADFNNYHGGRHAHRRNADGRRVHFEDEEFEDQDHEEGSHDDENPFGQGGRFDRRHHRRPADFEEREYHRGRRPHDNSSVL